MKQTIAIAIAAAALMLAACTSNKEVAYIHDAERNVAMPILNNYGSTLEPGDLLYIHVDSQNPEAVLQFNEETNRRSTAKGYSGNLTTPHGYLVSTTGKITMPILGVMQAAGLTQQQLADSISRAIKDRGYVNDALVTVKLQNFRVTVIGEVKKPQQLHGDGNRMTIFEALAQCGDVTMYGLRNCVTVIRTTGTTQTVDTLDLTSREVLNSPYYYLQQNDIVYVEPNDRRKRQAYRDDDWIRYTTTGLSVIRTAFVIVRRYQRAQPYINK